VFPVPIAFAKKFYAPHATTPSFYQENSRRSKENQKVSFLKYLTPPDFCFFDVRRRVEKNGSHWLKNGGVLRGSGRGGLRKGIPIYDWLGAQK
jgi:hypothetical protein